MHKAMKNALNKKLKPMREVSFTTMKAADVTKDSVAHQVHDVVGDSADEVAEAVVDWFNTTRGN